MPDSYNIKVKICLVGDERVGKTSLVRRYVMDVFDDEYISTFGTKISKKHLVILRNDNEYRITFSIWDVLGQRELKKVQKMAFHGSRGAIFVCDITREKTLSSILTWVSNVTKVCGQIPIILLANKSDLTDEYAFTEEDIKVYSSQLNAPYFLTSAKFGDNVIKVFFKMGNMLVDKIFGGDGDKIQVPINEPATLETEN